MNDRRAGMVLVAVGLVVVAIGAVGFVADRGAAGSVGSASEPSAAPSGTSTAAGPSGGGEPSVTTAAPTLAPSAVASPTANLTATPSPAPTPDAEAQVRAFYAVLIPAIKTGDADTLLSLLHPATVDRYGSAGCRASFATIGDPAYAVAIKTIHETAPWDYARDGLSVTIPDAVAVDVDVTTKAGTAAAVFHVAPFGGQLRWFADCGTPIGASPSP